MNHTKIVPTDLDSPCHKLSIRGLRFVVILSVLLELFLAYVYWVSNSVV